MRYPKKHNPRLSPCPTCGFPKTDRDKPASGVASEQLSKYHGNQNGVGEKSNESRKQNFPGKLKKILIMFVVGTLILIFQNIITKTTQPLTDYFSTKPSQVFKYVFDNQNISNEKKQNNP